MVDFGAPSYTKAQTDVRSRLWRTRQMAARVTAQSGMVTFPTMSPLPTFTHEVASTPSDVLLTNKIPPLDSSQLTVFGTRVSSLDAVSALQTGNTIPFKGSPPPWSIRAVFSGRRIALAFKGNTSDQYRLVVDGQIATASIAASATVNNFVDTYDFGAASAGVPKHLEVQMNAGSRFYGFYVPADESLIPVPHERPTVWMGDSFTEITITDNYGTTFKHDGYPFVAAQGLGYRHTVASGSGGTGYQNPGSSPRVTFIDRFDSDVLPLNPVRVIVAGGLNDANREASNGYTGALQYAAVTTLIDHIRAVLPDCEVIIMSPWTSSEGGSASLWAMHDAQEQAAADRGCQFWDVMSLTPKSQQVAGTLTAAWSSGGTITVTQTVPVGSFIRIGDVNMNGPAVRAMIGRRVNSVADNGNGTYTLSLSGTSGGTTYPAGTMVKVVGHSWVSGSGAQGSQTITVTGSPTGGTVTATLRGAAATWAYNAAISAVQGACDTAWGSGTVVVSGSAGVWVFTLSEAATYAPGSQVLGITKALTGGSSPNATLSGSPKGDGTADRFTGGDSTHPTRLGHLMAGRAVIRAAASAMSSAGLT